MEGTPFRWHLPTEQQTPPVEPQTPQDENAAPRRDQLPTTPLNMFQESSPSALQQQAASSGTDRSPWRTAKVVTELPAIPTRPNQSYGTTGTVSLPKMNINETNFSRFGNPQQGLLRLSAEAHQRRRPGAEGTRTVNKTLSRQPPPQGTQSQRSRPNTQQSPYNLPRPGRGEPPLQFETEEVNPVGEESRTSRLSSGSHRSRRVQRSTIDNWEDDDDWTDYWRPVVTALQFAWFLIKRYGPYVLAIGAIGWFVVTIAQYYNPPGAWKKTFENSPIITGRPVPKPPTVNRPGTVPAEGFPKVNRPETVPVEEFPKPPIVNRPETVPVEVFPKPPVVDRPGTAPVEEFPIKDESDDIRELSRRVKNLEIGLDKALKEKATRAELDRLYDDYDKVFKNYESARLNLDDRVQNLDKKFTEKLSQMGDKFDKAFKEIAELRDFARKTDAALNKLYEDLPKMMPVRYDSKDKIYITPDFWKDVTIWFKKQNFAKGSTDNAPPGRTVETETVIIEKPAKWEDFLARNEQQLNAHVAQIQEKWHQKALREQTLIPKEQHKELFKELRDEYLRHVEGQFKEVHHDLGTQLSDITNLKSLIGSGGVGGGVQTAMPIGKFLADGLYSHHISKLADYASLDGGAYVNPDLTSPTYEGGPQNAFVSFIHWAANMPSRIPKPGRVISGEPRKQGNCWPFAGQKGALGLLLREPIYVTGFTVEHMEWERTYAKDSAPKDLALWVQVNDTEKQYLPTVRAAAKALGVEAIDVQAGKKYPNMPEYVKMGTFEYEFHENSPPEQTFMIPLDMKRLKVASDRVVLHVDDNYGNLNYTCIYRVRVHGEPVRQRGAKLPVKKEGVKGVPVSQPKVNGVPVIQRAVTMGGKVIP